MALAVVQDLGQARGLPTPEELEHFETNAPAGFVLVRASAGLTDGTIQGDVGRLEKVRDWFGRPLWEREPTDANAYFGTTIRDSSPSLRAGRAGAISVFFDFLELRYRAALHQLTGRLVECPLDEMNRPRASVTPQLRIPPSNEEIEQLFAGWRNDLASCRKFAPAARDYTVARLSADVGLRVNRVLGETLATGADPLHLTTVFDLSETTATKYAFLARQILGVPGAEQVSANRPWRRIAPRAVCVTRAGWYRRRRTVPHRW
ncbi:hypothetical protein [Streptomyces celluloflavus]|uniref:hypothetical protein n=1 Tax=Streptomyces celluloflavus TaxID=58344 RepID=UPI003687ACC6